MPSLTWLKLKRSSIPWIVKNVEKKGTYYILGERLKDGAEGRTEDEMFGWNH